MQQLWFWGEGTLRVFDFSGVMYRFPAFSGWGILAVVLSAGTAWPATWAIGWASIARVIGAKRLGISSKADHRAVKEAMFDGWKIGEKASGCIYVALLKDRRKVDEEET
jgi:hypothetical protein